VATKSVTAAKSEIEPERDVVLKAIHHADIDQPAFAMLGVDAV
jgi:hypothetical protein